MSDRPVMPNEIELGRPLQHAVYDQHGRLLLKRGDVIRNEDLLQAVVARGYFREETAVAARSSTVRDPVAADNSQSRSVFRQIRALRDEHERLAAALRGAPTQANPIGWQKLAERLLDACAKDMDAALAAFHLDATEEIPGASARSVHSAVLTVLLAQSAQLEASVLKDVVCAALTHDMAMHTLSDALNRQSVALTVEQRRAVALHPEAGVGLLQKSGVESECWLAAVRDHHERIDGSGYPRGLTGDAISVAARIVAIVDTYTAMIRPRAYRGAVLSRDVLRQLFMERGKLVDEALASLFVREVGFYPPGSLVRLQNGEVAVVTRRGGHAATPKVRVVVRADGAAVPRPPLADTQESNYAITGVVPVQRYRSILSKAYVLWDEDAPAADVDRSQKTS